MPLTPLTEPLGVQRAAHLLRRACCGATIAQINQFAALTPQEAVALLFDPELPEPPLPLDPDSGTEWITTGELQDEEKDTTNYLLRWHIGQMLSAGVEEAKTLAYAFRERIVLFFHTHFTTKTEVVQDALPLYYQIALFRLFAFDQEDITVTEPDPMDPMATIERIVPKNLKTLTKKISVDNAMLVFLDGRYNVAGSPNENYARELMELYAIGKGLEGFVPEGEFEGDYINYTEQDVQAGAKVLSGFDYDDTFSNIDPDTGLPMGTVKGAPGATSHDNGTKTFSSRLGNATISPDPTLLNGSQATVESLLDEVDQYIELLYTQPETARYMCRKIYRFFVYHQIDQNLNNSVIQDLADVMAANEFKIQPVLEALFTSMEFYQSGAGYDDNQFGGLIKSPLDLVVGFARTFALPIPDYTTETGDFYAFTGSLLGSISGQGMDYYNPFEVAGYAAYHQFPIFNRNWITPNYITRRYDFVRGRVGNGMNDSTDPDNVQFNPVIFVQAGFDDTIARDARALILELARYLLPVAELLSYAEETSELTAARLNHFFEALYVNTGDNDPETAWTTRWDTSDPDAGGQLQDLLNAMLQSPEYQLM